MRNLLDTHILEIIEVNHLLVLTGQTFHRLIELIMPLLVIDQKFSGLKTPFVKFHGSACLACICQCRPELQNGKAKLLVFRKEGQYQIQAI